LQPISRDDLAVSGILRACVIPVNRQTMKPESDQDQLREVFIGRQPILDGNQSLIGYELQFHDTAIPPTDHAVATADMVCKAFIELGLADAFGQALTFIRVDGNFLDEDFVELLPPKTVVLEVDAATLRGEGKLERCRHLREYGYRFCLQDVTEIGEGVWPMVELVEWIKVDLSTVPPAQLQP
jgi:EAL and modified HD-GYP domain-containing signal transduction protein